METEQYEEYLAEDFVVKKEVDADDDYAQAATPKIEQPAAAAASSSKTEVKVKQELPDMEEDNDVTGNAAFGGKIIDASSAATTIEMAGLQESVDIKEEPSPEVGTAAAAAPTSDERSSEPATAATAAGQAPAGQQPSASSSSSSNSAAGSMNYILSECKEHVVDEVKLLVRMREGQQPRVYLMCPVCGAIETSKNLGFHLYTQHNAGYLRCPGKKCMGFRIKHSELEDHVQAMHFRINCDKCKEEYDVRKSRVHQSKCKWVEAKQKKLAAAASGAPQVPVKIAPAPPPPSSTAASAAQPTPSISSSTSSSSAPTVIVSNSNAANQRPPIVMSASAIAPPPPPPPPAIVSSSASTVTVALSTAPAAQQQSFGNRTIGSLVLRRPLRPAGPNMIVRPPGSAPLGLRPSTATAPAPGTRFITINKQQLAQVQAGKSPAVILDAKSSSVLLQPGASGQQQQQQLRPKTILPAGTQPVVTAAGAIRQPTIALLNGKPVHIAPLSAVRPATAANGQPLQTKPLILQQRVDPSKPGAKTVTTLAPGSTLRPLAPGQTLRPLAPGQTLRPLVPGTTLRPLMTSSANVIVMQQAPVTSQHQQQQQQPPQPKPSRPVSKIPHDTDRVAALLSAGRNYEVMMDGKLVIIDGVHYYVKAGDVVYTDCPLCERSMALSVLASHLAKEHQKMGVVCPAKKCPLTQPGGRGTTRERLQVSVLQEHLIEKHGKMRCRSCGFILGIISAREHFDMRGRCIKESAKDPMPPVAGSLGGNDAGVAGIVVPVVAKNPAIGGRMSNYDVDTMQPSVAHNVIRLKPDTRVITDERSKNAQRMADLRERRGPATSGTGGKIPTLPCPHCGKQCSYLKKHIRDVHQPKTTCPICFRRMGQSYLSEHMKIQHQGKSVPTKQCPLCHVVVQKLKNHLKSTHKMSKEAADELFEKYYPLSQKNRAISKTQNMVSEIERNRKYAELSEKGLAVPETTMTIEDRVLVFSS